MNATRWFPIMALSLGIATGCGPDRSNRSPTPDEDPARYARALQDEERVRRANQEAQARFFRAARLDLAEAEPDLSALSANTLHHETP